MHHPKRSTSFQIQLPKTEPLIRYLPTTSLHIVPVHGTVDTGFFSNFQHHLFHDTYILQVMQLNTLCSSVTHVTNIPSVYQRMTTE